MNAITEDFLTLAVMFLAIVAIVKILSEHLTTRKLMGAHLSDPALRDLLRSGQESTRQSALKWGLVGVAIGVALIAIDLLTLDAGSAAGLGITITAGAAGLLAYYAATRRGEGDS